jgi:four helix bundle protein
MQRGGFKDLLVWQKAFALTLEVYEATKAFPKEEQYGLVSQLRRAAVSIAANIAEGYERQHRKEYLQFLGIAKGSLGEVETYLLLIKELKYIQETEFISLENRRSEIGRLLRGLIRSLTGKQ